MKTLKFIPLYNFKEALQSIRKPEEKRNDYDIEQLHKAFYKMPFFTNILKKKGDQLLKLCLRKLKYIKFLPGQFIYKGGE